METGLGDRVAVVTGSTSGIGRATALAFGREGARVAVTYCGDEAAAESCAAEIGAGGGTAAVFRFDLAADGSAGELARQVTGRWGSLDVLVNCARGPGPERAMGQPLRGHATAAVARDARHRPDWPHALLQAAVPVMRDRGWGRIVLVSSGAGEEGWEGAAAYAAAKAGLVGLARSLAWELGREGILVNVVAAGLTLTERVRATAPPQVLEGIAGRLPSRRLSEPADVAGLIVFLASAANRNISGEILREGSATGRSAHAS